MAEQSDSTAAKDADEARDVAIEVTGLRTQFGSTVIHDDLDLTVYRGEVLGLVGGSGTGKSVLMSAIVGLLRPTRGTVRVFGRDPHKGSRAERQVLRRRWGVLFQDGALFSTLTVLENIMLPLKENTRLSKGLIADIARAKIALVGLAADSADKFPSELSGGMRKRAGLARALALDPQLLFLDEPTAGLDPIGAANFDQLIAYLQRSLQLTVFMVTHDLDSLTAICDRIAVLLDKKVTVGTLPELMAMDHPWLRSYFHGPRMRALQAAKEG